MLPGDGVAASALLIKIREHLGDLVLIDFRLGIAQRAFDAELDTSGNTEWRNDVLHECDDIGGVFDDFVLAGEVEQAADDVLAAVRLFRDHADVIKPLITFG